ncbi:hypothetical protein D3C76_1551990 [compost metagenome]
MAVSYHMRSHFHRLRIRQYLGDQVGLPHPFDEQNNSKHQPCLHGNRQISEYGQKKGNEHDQGISGFELQQLKKLPALAHIPGNHHQDGSHRRKRNAGGIRCKEQQDQEDYDTVNHA